MKIITTEGIFSSAQGYLIEIRKGALLALVQFFGMKQ